MSANPTYRSAAIDIINAFERHDTQSAMEMTRELTKMLGANLDISTMSPAAAAIYLIMLLERGR